MVNRVLRAVLAFGRLVRKAGGYSREDNVARMSAALAFYSLFALGPAILIAITLAGYAVGDSAALAQMRVELEFFAGPTIAAAVEGLLGAPRHAGAGAGLTILELGALAFGGSGIFVELRDSLDAILGTKARRAGLLRLIKVRSLAFGMVLAGSLVLLAGMVASVVMQSLLRQLSGIFPTTAVLVSLAAAVVLLPAAALLFALLYRELPRPKPAWREAWVGAMAAAVFFVAGEFCVSIYLGRTAPASPLGAAGSLIALLVWVYYSARIVYFGAELAKSYALAFGSRVTSPLP